MTKLYPFWVCSDRGEIQGKPRNAVSGLSLPGEEVSAQITTSLDRYKPPEPGQPPPPLSPGDWVYIGNVPLRFEVMNEAGNTVDLDIPQG